MITKSITMKNNANKKPLSHSFVGKSLCLLLVCLHNQMEMNNLETDVRGGIA